MKYIDQIKRSVQALHLAAITGSVFPVRTVVDQIKGESKGIADMVLGGIMIAILGFAMLFIGLYVTFIIQTSLPVIGSDGSASKNASSASYNSTVSSLNTYAATVFPVLGLSLLIVGFAVIFVALRSGMGGQAR